MRLLWVFLGLGCLLSAQYASAVDCDYVCSHNTECNCTAVYIEANETVDELRIKLDDCEMYRNNCLIDNSLLLTRMKNFNDTQKQLSDCQALTKELINSCNSEKAKLREEKQAALVKETSCLVENELLRNQTNNLKKEKAEYEAAITKLSTEKNTLSERMREGCVDRASKYANYYSLWLGLSSWERSCLEKLDDHDGFINENVFVMKCADPAVDFTGTRPPSWMYSSYDRFVRLGLLEETGTEVEGLGGFMFPLAKSVHIGQACYTDFEQHEEEINNLEWGQFFLSVLGYIAFLLLGLLLGVGGMHIKNTRRR